MIYKRGKQIFKTSYILTIDGCEFALSEKACSKIIKIVKKDTKTKKVNLEIHDVKKIKND